MDILTDQNNEENTEPLTHDERLIIKVHANLFIKTPLFENVHFNNLYMLTNHELPHMVNLTLISSTWSFSFFPAFDRSLRSKRGLETLRK